MNKAVYFGAGTDTKPYNFFPAIKLWISADSLPNSEYGDLFPFDNLYSNTFINRLDHNMLESNFRLDEIKNNL